MRKSKSIWFLLREPDPLQEGSLPLVPIAGESALFEKVGVNFDVLFPLLRSCGLFKNSSNGTGRLTGPAIYTLIRIDVKLFSGLKAFLILGRMNAINRADIDARGIFDANTRLSNYIGHGLNILLLARHRNS